MSPALATPPPPFIKAPYPGSKSTPGSIDASPCQLSTPINCASLSVPRIIGSFMWFQSRGLSRALSSSDPSPRSKLAPLLTSPAFSCGPLPLIIRSESVMSTGIGVSATDMVSCKNGHTTNNVLFAKGPFILSRRNKFSAVPKSTGSSSSDNNSDQTLAQEKEKVPFGYSRKDVLLIGLGVTLFGIGLKSGLEYGGVDPLQAGNVVQLVLVLGLTVGWISTYMFRVSNKDMTYAQQLRDYEKKVMEKRLEGLTEAELEALLEQVEEEKRQVPSGEQV